MVKQPPISNGMKLFLFVSGVLETFITVGIIFGWTPLLSILVSEGQYDELCPGGKGPCTAQSLKLNLIFTVSVSLFGATFLPAGIFLDKVGPRASRLLGSVIFTSGLVLFGASDSKKFDAFIPAYLLISLGSPAIFSSFFQWSSLFSRSELFITMLNCAFDAGAIVFFIFQMIYEHLHVRRSYIFYGYAILGVLIFLHSAVMKDPVKQERGRRRKRYAVEYFTDIKKAGWEMPKKHDDFYTFREQLRSIYYILPTACLVVVATMINYYVGTVSEQLAQFHPSEKTLTIFRLLFNTVFPLGTIVWVVPIGWMLAKFSIITSLFFGLTVGVAFGLVTCVTNLYVQFLAFILLSLFRPLIYSTLSTYITVVFGFRRFGSLYGVMNVINGVFSLGQYFLNYLVFNAFGGDFFRVNFGLTFLVAVMYAFPVFLKIRKRVHQATGDNSYLRVQDKIEQEISRNSMASFSNRSTADSSRLDLQTLNAAFNEFERMEREERGEEEEEGEGGGGGRGDTGYVPPPVTHSDAPLPAHAPAQAPKRAKHYSRKIPSAYNPFDEPSNPFDDPSSLPPPPSLPPPSVLSSLPPSVPSSSPPSSLSSQPPSSSPINTYPENADPFAENRNSFTENGNDGNPFTENEDDGNPFSEIPKKASPTTPLLQSDKNLV